ncbi:MAG: RluA family pseudouridine synthase [Phycisphaerales bacterium]|nr:RluA family pseudouridine synthase [Phycisphaerales bacterium]
MPAPPDSNSKIVLSILVREDDFFAINKPAGLVTQPGAGHRTDSLMNGLFAVDGVQLTRLGSSRDWGLLHRLDRETSGVILVARTAAAYDHIRGQFEARTIEKTYLALVRGRLPGVEGRCRQPLNEVRRGDMKISVVAPRGEVAVTHWRVLASSKDLALVACAIETGKLHQIRAHMAYLGAPVEGDRVYRSLLPPNTSTPPAHLRSAIPTLRLHAWRIAFVHPSHTKRVEVDAPIPQAFARAIAPCVGLPESAMPSNEALARLTGIVQGSKWWNTAKAT